MALKLLEPADIGAWRLSKRMIMAPMTRNRADDDSGCVNALVAQYYAQRAGAGLVISEGIYPSPMGKGYLNTPGLYSIKQVESWRLVTDKVHEAGGCIVAQLMHCGRISHPDLLPRQQLPLAPSAVRPQGSVHTPNGQRKMQTPRALQRSEISEIITQYALATRNALAAGFDGVELHAGTGYLPVQFLATNTNQRDDAYGGSIAHRTRFVYEVLCAMIAVAGAGRVGIKISPEMGSGDINDDDPVSTYVNLVDRITLLKPAYLHVALFGASVDYHSLLRPRFSNAYLAGGSFDRDRGEAMLRTKRADAIVYGVDYLANPDLHERFKLGVALNRPKREYFYQGGVLGYTDYDAWQTNIQ